MRQKLIDALQSFINEMKGFGKDLILVQYDEATHHYTFLQRGKTVVGSQLKELYFAPKKSRKFHILSYEGYQALLENLSDLLQGLMTNKWENVYPQMRRGFIEFYYGGGKLVDRYPGPQLLCTVKFTTVSNPLLVRLFLKYYSKNSKELYAYLKRN